MSCPVLPQAIDAPLSRSATFLLLRASDTPDAKSTIRSTLADISGLSKNVSIRESSGTSFSCIVGIGSQIWDALTALPRPAELHHFPVIQGNVHTAISTPGADLLFHIRADRRDLCFEFERQLMDRLGNSVTVVDETVRFRYFDARDLLGFVDGTANPVGPAISDSVLVTGSDDGPSAVGGTYCVVQKYVHDLKGWNALSAEEQEGVIGRTKPDNVELDDAGAEAQKSHKTLSTIEDDEGVEHDILRDNMPFGSPGSKEFGTYFISYSRRLWVTEKMLQRMFVGDPPGKHDRLLDFSTPLTGASFFVPSAKVLDELQ